MKEFLEYCFWCLKILLTDYFVSDAPEMTWRVWLVGSLTMFAFVGLFILLIVILDRIFHREE